jgi:hypothetical protein
MRATPPRSQSASPRARAMSTAMPPLKTSKKATTKAGPHPSARRTLVAPMFPEPTLRMSTP